MATPTLIVVGGPTASGKTRLAIALAQYFHTVILSADSRQFYQEMRIGNARPTPTELAAAKHYFIADRSLATPLSAGAYADEALELLKSLFQVHSTVVCVGGSGLYVQALTQGFDQFPTVPPSIRKRVDDLVATEGLAGLQRVLQSVDPTYFAVVDQQNPARLQRAIEVSWSSGQPYSTFLGRALTQRPFRSIFLCPYWDRKLLNERIESRIEAMLEAGLEAEVRSILAYRDTPAFRTVGYQEWLPYLDGQQSKQEVIALLARNSRRYAKRQRTWLRRAGHYKLVPPEQENWTITYINWLLEQARTLRTTQAGEVTTVTFSSVDHPPISLTYQPTPGAWNLLSYNDLHASTANYYLTHELIVRAQSLGLELTVPAHLEAALRRWGFSCQNGLVQL